MRRGEQKKRLGEPKERLGEPKESLEARCWSPDGPRLYQCGVFSDGEPAFTYVVGNLEYDGTLEMVASFCAKTGLTMPVPIMMMGVN